MASRSCPIHLPRTFSFQDCTHNTRCPRKTTQHVHATKSSESFPTVRKHQPALALTTTST
eukprot:TRINITY_DN3272_c1_g1_i1.p3 TRINITY_DN3272_c1_g1~~TRINITY_DN3272_c1_g1_i1.p3  ORF type:complete len:60 (+),score=2.12 TRINITY_DN3272_c1_g1_i1:227-406(+)